MTNLQNYANVVLEVNKAESLFEIIAEKKKEVEVKEMEKEIGGKGMVSGVCIGFEDPENPTVIMVPNEDPNKPEGHYGLPGGVIEKGENPTEALIREYEEETGEEYDSDDVMGIYGIPRTGLEGKYTHYLYLMEDFGVPLRTKGVPGEVGPPERIKLEDIAQGKIPVFYTHLEATFKVMNQMMAVKNRVIAHIVTKMAKRLNIDIEAE